MRTFVWLGSLLALCAAFPAQSQSLELKRVLLSLGGIGYYEFEAAIDGKSELQLPVRLDQVDDVLKSVVIFDDKGGVGQITLPSREPLSQAFRDLPFGQEALGSLDALINALAGTEVTVTGPRQIRGRVMGAVPETIRQPDGRGELTRHRVSVVAADGIKQFILEDAESFQFSEPALQKQIETALAAIARHRLQDQRVLTISANGSGKRLLRVGYVVGAPLWKASYRLTSPKDQAETKGLLQGWAIAENLSGQDWKNVELTLASGNPVTFRQQLYQAYFVNRPEIPVDVLARVAPPEDRGFTGTGAALRSAVPSFAPPLAAAPVAAPAKLADIATGEAQEQASQVLFKAPAPVSVRSGETLMLPIVNQAVPVERVALYQPGVLRQYPMAALRLTNDSGFGLPPGIMTIFEQGNSGNAHVGDARLALLPTGERRLLSYAVDYKVAISHETKQQGSVSGAKIARGVMTTSNRLEQKDVYRITAPPGEVRTLLVEHPRQPGWDLVAPSAGVEASGGLYRLALKMNPGPNLLEVTAQQIQRSTVTIGTMPRSSLVSYVNNGSFGANIRASLERLAGMMEEVDDLTTRVRDTREQAERIVQDQARLRQNLASVPAGSDIGKRYLDQMKGQEDRLDALQRTEAELTQKLRSAQAAFSTAVQKLDIEE